MVTDSLPRTARLREEYLRSDQMRCLALPSDDRFLVAARRIQVRVLRARPIRVREGGWGVELFGDYRFDEKLIRVWMRTAIQKRVTSFGTFFSTLCHEFCHHLDRERLGFSETPHTRGFFERTAALYHHSRATQAKRLYWVPLGKGRWRINWSRTNRAV